MNGFYKLGFGLLGAVGLFWSGRFTARMTAEPAERPQGPAAPECRPPEGPRQAQGIEPSALIEASAVSQHAGPDARDSFERDPHTQATYVMADLLDAVPRLESVPGVIEPPSQKAIAAATEPFVRGLAAGVRAAGPEVLDAVSTELTRRLCHAAFSQEQAIVVAQLTRYLPETVTSLGLDCFLARTQGRENAALWDMLGAWRRSGLERTEALHALERNARDPRTKRMFMSPEEMERTLNAENVPPPSSSIPAPHEVPRGGKAPTTSQEPPGQATASNALSRASSPEP